MKNACFSLIFITFLGAFWGCVSTNSSVHEEDMSWATVDGKYFVANLVKISGETVVFEKNGKIYNFPKNKLTPDSMVDAVRKDKYLNPENYAVPRNSKWENAKTITITDEKLAEAVDIVLQRDRENENQTSKMDFSKTNTITDEKLQEMESAVSADQERFENFNRNDPAGSKIEHNHLSGNLSLKLGEIPFGKSKNEIGIAGMEDKPIFMGNGGEALSGNRLHPPSSVRRALKIDRQWGNYGAKGYDDASMVSVLIGNFKAKERAFGFVQFFFVGPSKSLAVVSKHISVPYEKATLDDTFAGLRKALTKRVGVQPIEYDDELTSFFDKFIGADRLKAFGQFAIWSLSSEIVVLMSEFPEKEDNLAPVYIIHASKSMLQDYEYLQRKKDNETQDAASNAVNSAF